MRLSKLINMLEKKYPISLKEDWDNIGLLVGENSQDVKKVQVSLDITEKTIKKAISDNIDLIIAHHPIIFKGINRINNSSILGKNLIKLIRNNISCYILHTNIDAAFGGLNDFVVSKLGIGSSKAITTVHKEIYRLSVYIPQESYNDILEKIFKLPILESEKYKNITYTASFKESFMPLEGSNPNIGKVLENKINDVKKIEVLVEGYKLNEVLSEIKKIHPYEEMSYEIIKIENKVSKGGIGRYFTLEKEITIEKYVELVKEKLNIKNIRTIYKDEKRKIKKIGIINGSGASYIREALKLNLDLFITADIKYHEGQRAYAEGLAVFDIGHYESEIFFGELIYNELKDYIDINIYNDDPIFKFK